MRLPEPSAPPRPVLRPKRIHLFPCLILSLALAGPFQGCGSSKPPAPQTPTAVTVRIYASTGGVASLQGGRWSRCRLAGLPTM